MSSKDDKGREAGKRRKKDGSFLHELSRELGVEPQERYSEERAGLDTEDSDSTEDKNDKKN